jgi:predicted transcriptional regulator
VARPTSPRPTDGELSILNVLWKHSGRSVRQIRKELEKQSDVTNQSVLRRLEIMIEKGYVREDASDRPKIYYAVITEAKAKRRFVRDLIARLFEGSAKELVLHALKAEKTSASELSDIQRRLNKLKKSSNG